MTCNAFPTIFAHPMRALGWDVRKERTCSFFSFAKGLVTDWAFHRLPVEQRLVSFQILGKPLAAYRRHAFIRTVECKVRAFPSEKAIFGVLDFRTPKIQTLRPKGTNAPHRPFFHLILTWRPLERSSRADACKVGLFQRRWRAQKPAVLGSVQSSFALWRFK